MLLQVRVATIAEVSPIERELWTRWAGDDRAPCATPFFHPDFAAAVAAHRDDMVVLCLTQDGKPRGFWPMHRTGANRAEPLGLRLADYQGPIFEPGFACDLAEVLRQAGLTSYAFNHFVAATPDCQPWLLQLSMSPYADLRDGFAAYSDERRAAGSNYLRQAARKERKLAREIGPVRFVWRDEDPRALASMFAWKSQQRERSGTFDVLEYEWVRNVLTKLVRTKREGFAGHVASLYAGERLCAVHVGLCDRRTLHYWFPTYDVALARLSPGMILMRHLLQAAAERGLERVDFGRGEERYKSSLANANNELGIGSVSVGVWRTMLARTEHRVARMLDGPAWLRGPRRMLRRAMLRSLMRAD